MNEKETERKLKSMALFMFMVFLLFTAAAFVYKFFAAKVYYG